MATTAVDSMPEGTPAPNFSLPDVLTGKDVTLAGMAKQFPKGIVVIFLCRHCPYVQHVREELQKLAVAFMPKGIGFVGISANDPTDYPEDAPEGLREMVVEHAIPFPLLFDETQAVAKAFAASCTPDFFLFDGVLRLAYHGRFDASSPKNGLPVTGADLRAACEAVGCGEIVAQPHASSLGCSIKWKKEEEGIATKEHKETQKI